MSSTCSCLCSPNHRAYSRILPLAVTKVLRFRQSKNIDMEVRRSSVCECGIVHKSVPQTACAFWSVAVAPKYPIMQDIITFITVSVMVLPWAMQSESISLQEKGTYKAVTKDLWNMVRHVYTRHFLAHSKLHRCSNSAVRFLRTYRTSIQTV